MFFYFQFLHVRSSLFLKIKYEFSFFSLFLSVRLKMDLFHKLRVLIPDDAWCIWTIRVGTNDLQ